MTSELPVTYTSLKDKTIENSLFSYHLNQLIAQNIVEKSELGYSLTVEGSRWLNDSGLSMSYPEALRVNIILVIRDKDSNYLIGQRTGQFKAQINDYLLPSNYYKNDLDVSEQIENTITDFIPEGCLLKQTDFGFTQIKITYSDTKTMRSLFCISVCVVEKFEPLVADGAREYYWKPWSEIEKYTHKSAVLIHKIKKYTDNTINSRPTPVFIA